MNRKTLQGVCWMLFMFIALLAVPAAGERHKLSYPRSSELRETPHDSETVPLAPQQPATQPKLSLPTVPKGYEDSEHNDGVHHGYDGHHNWHLKGGRH